jgi:hypothetical protein
MNVRIGPLPAACYWHGGGVPLEQTTADPGGTTIVVLFLGGGGSLLLKLQPPNASGSTKAIRQVMRMRCIPADGTAFANEVAGQARWTPTAPHSATLLLACRPGRADHRRTGRHDDRGVALWRRRAAAAEAAATEPDRQQQEDQTSDAHLMYPFE